MDAPLRVVIADDDASLQLLLTLALGEDDRFELVDTVTDGRAVVDRVRWRDPDVLVLDLELPGAGGLDVLEALVGAVRPLVIVLSAGGREDAARALAAGAAAYLDKTAVAEDLAGAIHRVVEAEYSRS